MVEIKEFDAMRITNASIQNLKNSEVNKFGCLGTIEGETEMRTIIKKCEGVVRKSRSMPIQHDLTLAGYVPVKILRDLFGLTNENLKTGIYSYGINSKGIDFVLTADVIDDFEDVTKLVAFPNCTSATGLKYSIDNEADEVAYVELEFMANPDKEGQFYYEAFVADLEEPVKTAWHNAFNRELVEKLEA